MAQAAGMFRQFLHQGAGYQRISGSRLAPATRTINDEKQRKGKVLSSFQDPEEGNSISTVDGRTQGTRERESEESGVGQRQQNKEALTVITLRQGLTTRSPG